ncbi:uncharacterized protein PF11_0213-like isoform X2 [Stegodyphus dumicola]|nr:uncharacterized protein PF11_0213-like isoform X2 [Stegodyphus dumicola]XP_035232373.1 uncharacterized protein PF11_0213-like isoform X2 [Stegodyphus dumicola]
MASKVKIKNAEPISDSNIWKSLKTYAKRRLSPSVNKAVNEQNEKNGYKCESYDREINSLNQKTEKSDSSEKQFLELQMPDKNDSGNQTGLEIIQNSNVSKINMDELKMDFENSMFVKTLPIKKRRATSQSNMTVQETKSEIPSFAVASVTESPGPLKIISTNLNSDSGIGNEKWKTESGKPVKKRRRVSKSSSSLQLNAKSEMSLATSETRSPKMNVKSSSEDRVLSNDISSTNKRSKKQSQTKIQKPKIKKSLKKKVDLVKKKSRIFPKRQLNVFKSNRKEKSSQNQLSTNKTKSLCEIVDQNSSELKSSKDNIKDTELQLSVDPSKCQSSKSDSDMCKEESVSNSVPFQYLEKDLSQEAIKNVHSSTEKIVESDNVKESFSSSTVLESERRKSLRGCSKKLRYRNFEYPDIVKRAKKIREMQDSEVISKNCKLNGIKYPNTTQQNKHISKRKNFPLVDETQNTKGKKKEVELCNSVSSETASGKNSPDKINCTTAVTKTRMLTRKLSKSMPDNKTEHNGSKSNEMQFLNSIQRDILNIEKTQPFVSLIDCNKNLSFIQLNIGKKKLPVTEEISTPIKVKDVLNSGVSCEEKEMCDNENIHLDEKSNIKIENPDMQTFLPFSNKLKDDNEFRMVNAFTANKLNKLSNGKFGVEATIENDINSVKTKISQNDVQSPKTEDRKLSVRSNSKTLRENIKVSSNEEHQLEKASKDAVRLEVTPNSKNDFTGKLELSSSKTFEESELSPSSAEHRKRRGQTPSISAKTEVSEGKGKSLSNFLHVKENNTEKFIADSSTSVHKQPSLMDMVKRYSLSSKTNSVDSPWSPQNNHIVNRRLSVQRKNKTSSSFHSSPSIEKTKREQTSSVDRYVRKSKANVNKLQKVIKSNSIRTTRNSKSSCEVPNTQQTQSKIISEVSTGILKKKAVNCMSPAKNNDSKHEFTNFQETSSAAAVKIIPAKKKSVTTHSKDSFASIETSKVENKIDTGIAKKVLFDIPQVKQTVENSNASILNSASVPQIVQNVQNSVPVLNSIPMSQIIQTAQNNNVSIMNSVPVSQIMQATENNCTPINSGSGNFSAPKVMNIFGNCSAGSSNLLVPTALPTNFYSPLNAVIPCYSQIAPYNSNPYVIIPPVLQFQNNAESYLLPALPARFVSDIGVQASIFNSKYPSSVDNCVYESILLSSENQFDCEQTLPNSSDNSKYVAESSSTRLERSVEEHSSADCFQSSSLLFSDFLHFVSNVASEIRNNSVMTSKFHAEEWFEENSFSRNMTVRQFCTNSKLMKTLSGQFCQKVDEYNDVSVQYKFPDGFEDFELLEVLKDYINFHLRTILEHFSINTLPFSSESVISYVYSSLSFIEGMYMSCLLCKSCSELEIKDLLPCFLLSGLLVIYNEFSERVQEQYVNSNMNS